jgi:hypothetical protein
MTHKKQVELGIRGARVPCGAHIACFCQTEGKFAESAGFLEIGLKAADHCIIIRNRRTIKPLICNLLERECDLAPLLAESRLMILDPDNDADQMASNIRAAIQSGITRGAACIRVLGSPGWGDPCRPAEKDLIRLEQTFTSAVAELPCVVVCMYDLRIVPDRIIKTAALNASSSQWFGACS